MTTIERPAVQKSWWLTGNYAPVPDEIEAFDLAVTGTLPPQLDGLYVRNGANPRHGESMHWFMGDGMLHGIRIQNGKASWYRNRYVKTKTYGGADRMAADNILDKTISTANTHVLSHAGKLLSLEEGSFPTVMDLDLNTIGTTDFGGKLTTAFTAHPKVCGETGEMMAFGYGFIPDYLTYHRLSAAGDLVQTEVINVPASTMMHDFAATRNHVIFFDLPVTFNLDLAIAGDMPYAWDDNYRARMGIMPRAGNNADVKWFDVDPCFVFHAMNAFEDTDGNVVLDAGRHASMWRGGSENFEPSYLHRWTFNMDKGTVGEQRLDDASHGFPRVDPRRECLSYRYGYAVMQRDLASKGMDADSVIVRYDMETGERVTHDFGGGKMCGEPVFVPAHADAAEDDGYVMTFMYDKATDCSSYVVLNAGDIAGPLVAEVVLPRRVPHGFHGSWVSA
jgi:carotenoid cleavage dioxygenase-like enzyme